MHYGNYKTVPSFPQKVSHDALHLGAVMKMLLIQRRLKLESKSPEYNFDFVVKKKSCEIDM